MRGCNWYTQTQSDWEDQPFHVVCGDSAADFCLALALDRCYGDGAWFPQLFAQAEDDLANVVRTTLARVIDSRSRPIVMHLDDDGHRDRGGDPAVPAGRGCP